MLENLKNQLNSFLNIKFFWIILILFFSFPAIILSLIYSQGFNWPDEIFQSMELAYHIVTGRGDITWEYREQSRSTLYPQLLSLWLRLVYIFTFDPRILYISTRFFLSLFFLGSLLSISYYFLFHDNVNKNSKPTIKYLFLIMVVILFPLNYYFGFRTLAESISSSLTIIAIFMIQSRIENKNQNILFYSFLIGFTYGIRFQMALFFAIYALFLVHYLWYNKLYASIKNLILGLVLGFIVYLLSDLIYFGIPFISSIKYFKVTILDGVGDNWGTSPFSFYFKSYYRYLNILLVLLIPGIYYNFRKHYPIILGLASFILIHSLIAHKELRFIYFTFPVILFYIASGIWNIYNLMEERYNKIRYLFIIVFLMMNCFQYSVVLKKKIQWNFLDDNLQLFLQATQNGVNGNSLVTIQDTFAWGAGYVYLGPNFKGILKYFDMNSRSAIEQKVIMEKTNFKNLLIHKNNINYYCKSFGYCEELFSKGEYIWVSKL
ncbi:MAG: hypothetical protein MH321_07600 [Leptospiraceae bacterium]|nr:hypothetical protein [Leptospiraceae bacterium]